MSLGVTLQCCVPNHQPALQPLCSGFRQASGETVHARFNFSASGCIMSAQSAPFNHAQFPTPVALAWRRQPVASAKRTRDCIRPLYSMCVLQSRGRIASRCFIQPALARHFAPCTTRCPLAALLSWATAVSLMFLVHPKQIDDSRQGVTLRIRPCCVVAAALIHQ